MAVIAFDARVLNERGSSVAILDYALALECELGHRAVVFHETGTADFNPSAVRLVSDSVETIGYSDSLDLSSAARATNVDVLYAFSAKDRRLVPGVKNVRHIMFQHFPPYGDVSAYISEWMARRVSMSRRPWVPHIVKLRAARDSLRRAWGFPDNAVVIGRHGGFDQFDLPFAHGAIEAALQRRRDLYFAFLNTRPFIQSDRVRFLAPVWDPQAKSDFIASCDAMIHGRKAGEGFGLAVAEFLLFDKPVIAWAGGKDRNHLELIPDRRYIYRTAKDLLRILLEFEPAPTGGRYSAAVAKFAPELVMRRFGEVFIDEGVPAGPPPPFPWVAASKLGTRAMVLQGRLWRDQGMREVRAMRRAAAP